MKRIIRFNSLGDIVVETERYTEQIQSGIVLLAPKQVIEAERNGWREILSHNEDIEHGLRRVQKP